MCLETHFQYKFPILGRFGQSGREKKIQTAISVLLLRPGLSVFMGKNHFKYPYVRTEKIHNMNAIFAFQINQESKIG